MFSHMFNPSKFHEHEFEEMFDGEVYHFRFFYRNPWNWLLDLVSDPTLADDIVWYPSRKYLVVDGNRQRLRDEFWNSDKWWNMQVPYLRLLSAVILTSFSEYTTCCRWNPPLCFTAASMARQGSCFISHKYAPDYISFIISSLGDSEWIREWRRRTGGLHGAGSAHHRLTSTEY
jgi:hypothetical protein